MKLETENHQLVDKWLRKKAEEAEKMNAANSVFDSMVDTIKRKTMMFFSPPAPAGNFPSLSSSISLCSSLLPVRI